MLDLSKDERCKSLEESIDFYANAVKERQIICRELIGTKKSPKKNPYKVKKSHPYPYDDEKEHNLIEAVNAYISSHPSKEDQKQIAGHFLFKIKKYHGHPFERHMAKIVDDLVALYPLSDKDKVHYLEYVLQVQNNLETRKFGIYQESTLREMAKFDLLADETATNRVFLKLYSFLNRKQVNHDDDAKLMYGMITSFVTHNLANSREFDRDQVVSLAKFYFRVSDKTLKTLDSEFLGKALFSEEESFRRGTFREVVSAYSSHFKTSKTINVPLHRQMGKLISGVVYYGNYGLDRKDELKSFFDGVKGQKKEYAEALQKMIDKAFQERLKTMPSRVNILEKARRIFMQKDGTKSSEDVFQDIVELCADIKANAKLRGINIEHPTFFDPNTYQINAVDKKLVKDVADVYVQAYKSRKVNETMENAATEMFTKLVCCDNYDEKDARELGEHIAPDEFAEDGLIKLSKSIRDAYALDQDIKNDSHYFQQKKKIIFPKSNSR